MKISKALRSYVEKAKERDSYWFEKAKLQFAMSLDERRRLADMNYKAVAAKLGTSAAYVTKVFRGDTNMTIESMVKLARATGGRLDVRVVEADTGLAQWDVAHMQPAATAASTTASATATVLQFPMAGNAANHDKYRRFAAA